jgi:hypothetical protein
MAERVMQNARLVDSTITVMYYGSNPPYIEGEHIRLDSETEDADYDNVHIFRIQKDEWKDLDEVTVPYIGTVRRAPSHPRRRLVAMTMFKDDYLLIPAYVKYYTELGVEHFYLYYNKRMGSDPLPELPEVTYTEWDYPYYTSCGSLWAQITAINDFLYWSKHFADYVLFNDLDEFIQVPLDLTCDKLCYGFNNRFVELDNPEQSVEVYDSIKNKNFKTFEWANEFPRRGKCIVSTKHVTTMGVHQPNIPRFNNENTKVLGEFYHVSNFKGRHRVTATNP